MEFFALTYDTKTILYGVYHKAVYAQLNYLEQLSGSFSNEHEC